MERMHREDYLQAAMATPLFRGLPAAFVKDAAARGYAECFAAGTPVFLSGDAKRRLGVLVSGKAEVYKPAGTGRVLMSVLTPGALLGAEPVPGGCACCYRGRCAYPLRGAVF